MIQKLRENMLIIPIILLLVLFVYGIILFLKSKKIKSKFLKIGLIIPLIVFTLGIIWWIGDNILGNPFGIDFGDFLYVVILLWGIPLSTVSIIFSTVSLIKLERKFYPIVSITCGIIYLIISIIFRLAFTM